MHTHSRSQSRCWRWFVSISKEPWECVLFTFQNRAKCQVAKSLFFRSISLSLELCTQCMSMSYAFITCIDTVIPKSVQASEKPHKQLNIMRCHWAADEQNVWHTFFCLYIYSLCFDFQFLAFLPCDAISPPSPFSVNVAWNLVKEKRISLNRQTQCLNSHVVDGKPATVYIDAYISKSIAMHCFLPPPRSFNSFIAWQTTISPLTEITHNRSVNLY